MLQVPFVQKRADQFARVLYELSQAFEVPEVDPQASLIETALAGFRGELRKPRADNRWAREYWAEVDALFGQAPGAERGE